MIVEGCSYTFREVDERANRLARSLIAAGADKGARVAVLLDNGPDSIPVDFAIAKAGLNKVPLNARLSLEEQARMVAEAQVDFLLFGASLIGFVVIRIQLTEKGQWPTDLPPLPRRSSTRLPALS